MRKKRELVAGIKSSYDEMPRDEMNTILDWMEGYYDNDDSDKVLQTLVGLPGAGKSVLLRMSVNEMRKNDDKFICQIDISDCADEIDVYFKIACELQIYYQNNSKAFQNKKYQKRALNQFFTMYEWLYGKAGEYPSTVSLADDVAEGTIQATELLKNGIDKFLEERKAELQGDKIAENLGIACELLGKVTNTVPYVKCAKMLVDLVVEGKEQQKLKQLLQDTLDAFASLNRREEIFRSLLLAAMPQSTNGSNVRKKYNPIIILDNFQLAQNGELGRDHTWLSRPGRLMAKMNALWIIASRDSTIEHFISVFQEDQIQGEFVLQGFSAETARKYVEGKCKEILAERDMEQKIDSDVVDKMLSVCAMSGHNFVGNQEVDSNQIFYLPYLLNLVTIHFRRLCEDPACVITPDSFVGLKEKEEFIGYYFYKDLSDLMTNAFQILCCLSTWDDKWIEIVRNRFDNHLLNAKNLLFKTAPMEQLGADHFKLHEAIRDGLYNNSRNYIKQDVLNYLFEEFIRIYGSDEARKHRELWYKTERLQTFFEIVYKYISPRAVKEKDINRMNGVMERIYKDNAGRGYVTDGFIRIYSGYIDQLRRYYNIPFVDVLNGALSADNLDMLLQNVETAFVENGTNFPDMQQAVYYMQCCFWLANLYTNLNMSEEARNLEKLCLRFWDCMEKMVDEQVISEVALWQCRRQRIKAINSIAFDSSQEHDYAMAYQHGTEGLDLLDSSLQSMVELLEVPEEVRFIISPEETSDFTVNTCTEISVETYEKLKKGYEKLLDWSAYESEQEEPDKVLQRILAEMLLEEQQNLRGNYPWYCLKTEGSRLQKSDCWQYGARTYWMRRARLEVAESDKRDKIIKKVSDYQKKMIISYHNVCVYLYKAEEVRTACILEKEVMDQSRKILPPDKELSSQAQMRISQIQEKEKDSSFLVHLWQREINTVDATEELKENNEILEQTQYMGDYYLHMGFYAIALKHFCHVALSRYVRFGILDNRTLDSFIRLYIAAFAHQDQEMAGEMLNYFDEELWQKINQEDLKKSANGLVDKIKCLKRVIEISKDKQLCDEEIIRNMLAEVDDKQKGCFEG